MNSLKRNCGFSFIVDFPSTSLQKVLKDQSNPIWSTRWCDISHPLSVYCLGVVLHAIFPRTPLFSWPTICYIMTNKYNICNIPRCIMQYSGQQYAIFWTTNIVYTISWPTNTMCNILTNNFNMQFCKLDIPLFFSSFVMPIGQICMSLWKSNTADLLN